MVRHLAVFDKGTIDLIFGGKKKIEGRFSQIRIPPFGKAASGDLVWMKVSGGKIEGQFTIDRVFYFDHPQGQELLYIKKKYAKDMAMPAAFWLSHEKVNYVTLMFIKSVTRFIV